MNGKKIGNQEVTVTLHEPRKLRPEKLAERVAQGLIPLRSSRSFSGLPISPIRLDRGILGKRREMVPNQVGIIGYVVHSVQI